MLVVHDIELELLPAASMPSTSSSTTSTALPGMSKPTLKIYVSTADEILLLLQKKPGKDLDSLLSRHAQPIGPEDYRRYWRPGYKRVPQKDCYVLTVTPGKGPARIICREILKASERNAILPGAIFFIPPHICKDMAAKVKYFLQSSTLIQDFKDPKYSPRALQRPRWEKITRAQVRLTPSTHSPTCVTVDGHAQAYVAQANWMARRSGTEIQAGIARLVNLFNQDSPLITVFVDGEGYRYALGSHYRVGAMTLHEKLGQLTPQERQTFLQDHAAELGALTALMMIVGQTDAHGGNIMVSQDGHLFILDYDLCYQSKMKQYTFGGAIEQPFQSLTQATIDTPFNPLGMFYYNWFYKSQQGIHEKNEEIYQDKKSIFYYLTHTLYKLQDHPGLNELMGTDVFKKSYLATFYAFTRLSKQHLQAIFSDVVNRKLREKVVDDFYQQSQAILSHLSSMPNFLNYLEQDRPFFEAQLQMINTSLPADLPALTCHTTEEVRGISKEAIEARVTQLDKFQRIILAQAKSLHLNIDGYPSIMLREGGELTDLGNRLLHLELANARSLLAMLKARVTPDDSSLTTQIQSLTETLRILYEEVKFAANKNWYNCEQWLYKEIIQKYLVEQQQPIPVGQSADGYMGTSFALPSSTTLDMHTQGELLIIRLRGIQGEAKALNKALVQGKSMLLVIEDTQYPLLTTLADALAEHAQRILSLSAAMRRLVEEAVVAIQPAQLLTQEACDQTKMQLSVYTQWLKEVNQLIQALTNVHHLLSIYDMQREYAAIAGIMQAIQSVRVQINRQQQIIINQAVHNQAQQEKLASIQGNLARFAAYCEQQPSPFKVGLFGSSGRPEHVQEQYLVYQAYQREEKIALEAWQIICQDAHDVRTGSKPRTRHATTTAWYDSFPPPDQCEIHWAPPSMLAASIVLEAHGASSSLSECCLL